MESSVIARRARFAPIVVAACLPAIAATVEYSHRIWRIEDGLPQNKIQAIAQTPDGYLWIGTSEGLARFDGVRFAVFDRSNTSALQDDSILALTTARDGSLWIETEGGGLLHYRAGSFRAFGAKEGLTNGFIRAIHEDSDGVVWAGADRGLFRMTGQRFERLDSTPEIPLASVVSILADRKRKLWIASSAGLLSVEGGKLIRIRCKGEALVSPIRALYQSRDGILYTVNRFGVSQLRDGCSVPDPAAPKLALTLLHGDRAGNLWIGTIGAGLMRYRAGALTTFEAPSVLPDNNVSAIFEDQEDNLWIGGPDGILRLSKTAVSTVSRKDGLADDNVSSVYEDHAVCSLRRRLYACLTKSAAPPWPAAGFDRVWLEFAWWYEERFKDLHYSINVESLARTSSVMKSGTFSMNRALRANRSSTRGWLQSTTPLCLRSGATQGDRKAGMAGEIPALRDRAHKWGSQDIESFRRDDQHVARSALLTALDGIQIDVENVAALHSSSLAADGGRVQPGAIFG